MGDRQRKNVATTVGKRQRNQPRWRWRLLTARAGEGTTWYTVFRGCGSFTAMSPRYDPHYESAMQSYRATGIIPRELIMQIQNVQSKCMVHWALKYLRDTHEHCG